MMKFFAKPSVMRIWMSGAALLAVGGCLSDQQLSSILQSAVSTGLNTLLTGALDGLVNNG